MVLSPRVTVRVIDTILAHDLHRSVPVDILKLAEQMGWDVRISRSLKSMRGFAIVYHGVRKMGINGNLDVIWQRAAIGHELSHVLAEHSDTVYTMTNQPLWNTKQEHEANRISAELLIPDWVLREHRTIQEVAVACNVPVELVQVKLGNEMMRN